jgi:hypothetical protein
MQLLTIPSRPNNASNIKFSGGDQTLLTVPQVAALDCCSEKTVRRAISIGLLHATRIGPCGRLLRISKAAHKAYRQASML